MLPTSLPLAEASRRGRSLSTAASARNSRHRLPWATVKERSAPPAPTSREEVEEEEVEEETSGGRVAAAACACTASLARCAA